MEKRRKTPKEQFLLFSTIFSICISNFKSPITYIFVKCGCLNYFFLNSENLICRGTDISKCFRVSELGIRDNENRLYMFRHFHHWRQFLWLAPETNSFPIKLTPFQKRTKTILTLLKNVSFPLNHWLCSYNNWQYRVNITTKYSSNA